MANFFTDNHDIQFLLEYHDVPRLAEIMEEGFTCADEFDQAPRDGEEACEKYRQLLTELGRITADEIAPTAQETDEIGKRTDTGFRQGNDRLKLIRPRHPDETRIAPFRAGTDGRHIAAMAERPFQRVVEMALANGAVR